MFENTKKALEVFQGAIECAQCKKPKKNLQYLGTSCKHAHCWDCIAEFDKKVPGKRSTSRHMCSTCAFPLDLTNIRDARMLNTCFSTLDELKELLEQANSTFLTQADMACTQKIFDGFEERCPNKAAEKLEQFLETQAHMPDELGQPEEEDDVDKQRIQNRENSISPELDIFYNYQSDPNPKKPPSKRSSTTEIPSESKPKRASILKNSVKNEKNDEEISEPVIDLFSSQIPKRTHENEKLTPFINRRSTAPASSSSGGLIGKYVEPFRSLSVKKEVKEEIDENPFTKKIVLHKRQASMEQLKSVKIERQESPDPDGLPIATSSSKSRRNSVRFENIPESRRSQSPMSFGEKSMGQKGGEQRRSSFGTRRGEVVIINSILNNRIPQLKSAVEAGTCVNEKDKSGKTPLFVAVEQNSIEAVEILVEAGAVINAVCGPTYETALHEAIRRKNVKIIEYLLSKGASMKIRNGSGKTPEEIGKGEPKIKKIMDRFRNEHVLQPVIPPPKSKIHFVQLIDDKLITEAEKKKLPGKINIVNSDMDTPTHIVVPVNLKTKVMNITKEHLAGTLKAIVKSGMIVSREWLKACIINESKVDEDRLYAVKKVQWMDGPVFENTIDEWKKQITRMQPKLFAGCKFYFPFPRYNNLDRVSLIEIVRGGGGSATTREPLITDKDLPPYHNTSLKPNFVVYSFSTDVGDKYRDCTKYNLVSEHWIIEAILGCSIKTPPY